MASGTTSVMEVKWVTSSSMGMGATSVALLHEEIVRPHNKRIAASIHSLDFFMMVISKNCSLKGAFMIFFN